MAFDARTTKLHAKAWLLERGSGLSTAFVGSSNLSHTALFDGLEWNVRLSSIDAAHVDRPRPDDLREPLGVRALRGLRPRRRTARSSTQALREHDRRSLGEVSTISFANLDVRPYPHQQRMLETLDGIERERHDRHRNLVVAATGTGKTVVAALDYRALVRARWRQRPLAAVRRAPRGDPSAVAGHVSRRPPRRVVRRDPRRRPNRRPGRHVFAMIQSLGADRLEQIAIPTRSSRRRRRVPPRRRPRPTTACLSTCEPRELLGLTATPERLDGQDVTEWFDGPDRRRAASLGGDRRGLPRPVPVLRRRRWHRPQPGDLAARRLRRPRS